VVVIWFENLRNASFNAANFQILTISADPLFRPLLHFCNQVLNWKCLPKNSELIFHRPSSWRLHISMLYDRTMSVNKSLKRLRALYSGFHFWLARYRAYGLRVLDWAEVAYNNCSVANTNLLENVLIACAKHTLGCLKWFMSHANIFAFRKT